MRNRYQPHEGRLRRLWQGLNPIPRALLGVPVLAVVYIVLAWLRLPDNVVLPDQVLERNRQTNALKALQDELASAINRQESIGASEVHLFLPFMAVSTDPTFPPSGVVILTFREGTGESDADIDAVIAQVTNAVEGLAAERVTVTDSGGRVIAEGTGRLPGEMPQKGDPRAEGDASRVSG